MDRISIVGQNIELHRLPQSEEKGLWFGLLIAFRIYKFSFNNSDMLLLEAIGEDGFPPGQLRKIADRIYAAKHCESVFYFDSLPTFERDRLVKQGVYFIVGEKFAMLPQILMNRLMGKRNFGETLRPAAQYMLLSHLQEGGFDGKSFKDLEMSLHYKYATIANAVKQLEEVGLMETTVGDNRVKRLAITMDNASLWEKAQKVLTSPICKVIYASNPVDGVIGGVSALSEYSMLAPENVPTRVLTQPQFKEYCSGGLKAFPTEDMQRIEVWSYPPISKNGFADKLSLYLSLKDNKDPRVEKELELMMKKLW